MSTNCRDHWASLMERLGNPTNAEAVYTKLIELYSEPHRAYHNLSHINMLLDEHREIECQHLELELAIWFHDAIYNPRAKDNEDRSATLAFNSIIDFGLSIGMANQVEKLIMATKHVELPKDDAARLLVDLDLMSLGGSEAEFDVNSAAIRKEYEHVPLADYCKERCRILQSFLDRPTIYSTRLFQEKYEESARANLRREIARLQELMRNS